MLPPHGVCVIDATPWLARTTYPEFGRFVVEVELAQHGERRLCVVIKLPRLLDGRLAQVAHVAVLALEGRRQRLGEGQGEGVAVYALGVKHFTAVSCKCVLQNSPYAMY